jgi:hypothetical protein
MDKQTEGAFIAQVRKLMSVAQFFQGEERGDDAVSALACIRLLLPLSGTAGGLSESARAAGSSATWAGPNGKPQNTG